MNLRKSQIFSKECVIPSAVTGTVLVTSVLTTLSQHITHQKSCHSLELLNSSRFDSDLSNEALYAFSGQEAAKEIEVNFGV